MSSLLALMLATGMTFFHPVTQYDLTEEEWCIARVVYFEAASSRNPEPYIELQTIAYVVHARKRDNRRKWGGDTACGVLLKTREEHGNFLRWLRR